MDLHKAYVLLYALALLRRHDLHVPDVIASPALCVVYHPLSDHPWELFPACVMSML